MTQHNDAAGQAENDKTFLQPVAVLVVVFASLLCGSFVTAPAAKYNCTSHYSLFDWKQL